MHRLLLFTRMQNDVCNVYAPDTKLRSMHLIILKMYLYFVFGNTKGSQSVDLVLCSLIHFNFLVHAIQDPNEFTFYRCIGVISEKYSDLAALLSYDLAHTIYFKTPLFDCMPIHNRRFTMFEHSNASILLSIPNTNSSSCLFFILLSSLTATVAH